MAALTPATHLVREVRFPEDAVAVRAMVRAVLKPQGASSEWIGRAETSATELVNNLLHHASPGGYMLVGARPAGLPGVELVSVDNGPGIVDVARAMRAEVRRPGGLGLGLGSVERFATVFDIYSRPVQGTVVVAQFLAARPPEFEIAIGGISVAAPNEDVAGDRWCFARGGEVVTVLVVDGMGHGAAAAVAAEAALATFVERSDAPLEDLVPVIHEGMRGTRGGAIALVRVDPRTDTLHHVAVGNIEGRLLAGDGTRSLVGRPGSLGTTAMAPRATLVDHPWSPGATLLLASDGVRNTFDFARFPGLEDRHASLLAALWHRDHRRRRDDETAIAIRDLRGRPR